MSLIKDVVNELKVLDFSQKSIKKFGFTVGTVFVLLSALMFWLDFWQSVRFLFLLGGMLLILGAILKSKSQEMKIVYRFWMGIAFFLGWIMSRVILSFLFFVILTPIGFIAKIFGKKFLDLKFKSYSESYWIPKENKQTDYEKMF
ncbi:MAG: SxtJ family membrane protein [Bacteroidota bacterium]